MNFDSMPFVLPGTEQQQVEFSSDELSKRMLDGAHLYVERKIKEATETREQKWHRDFSSLSAYDESIKPNLNRFRKYIGLEDSTNRYLDYNAIPYYQDSKELEKNSLYEGPNLTGISDQYQVHQVRWLAMPGVYGTGLLLEPEGRPVANIIVIPDADQTPEQLAGLNPGLDSESQIARQLAESGFQVLIPTLISREKINLMDRSEQTHREWIYSQAFHMGRHIIGFEVQKIIAAVDWFKGSDHEDLKIGIIGYGEGGLIGFYTAAVDKRVDATLVSGYFNKREQIWEEPIYRNVWGFLEEFGDAEIAAMIAPRSLVVDHSFLPKRLIDETEIPAAVDIYSSNGYKGSLKNPAFGDVQAEFDRIATLVPEGFQNRALINQTLGDSVVFCSKEALQKFVDYLDVDTRLMFPDFAISIDLIPTNYIQKRQISQLKELEMYVQNMLRVSDQERNRFFLHKVMPEFASSSWSTKAYHPYFPKEHFKEEGAKYREYFLEEVLGRFDEQLLPPGAKTKKIYDEVKWTGYEVILDVFDELIAPGILLIPKDLKTGERRPVVVVQHGRGGVPSIVIEGNTSYNDIASKLVDQGFIVYAPYGLFRGEDRYRWLDRKANSIKKTLFSFIIAQHQQNLKWLSSLPFVDSTRIAFYGKSYGGETAMRVPAVLEGYCLSICSADFGDWTRKVVDATSNRSFITTIEWEMPYFNMGSTFSYAEMAYLIFPRPFMVERGHHDLVQPDEWVGYEYAKVRYLYDQFNLVDRTEIEYFNGGHASRNDKTFEFLHKFLQWP